MKTKKPLPENSVRAYSDARIRTAAKRTFTIEAASITELIARIDKDFCESVRLIYQSKGRLIVSGIGKSAIIAQKMVATFNSTGTPSDFMHAADAIHGDLGVIQRDDIVILISNSGNTPEIKVLAPLIKSGGNKLIAITGNTSSELSGHADFILNTSVQKEACPNNLAPTSSTTAQLAMGDALAVCLLEMRGFTASDFARYHPGGALGKKLYLKVADLYINNARPEVNPETPVSEVILTITSNRLGATAVISKGKLSGIITDGDLRRMMQKQQDYHKLQAKNIMNHHPKTIGPEVMAVEALQMMKAFHITQLVVAEKGKFLGFIHLHDLLKEGIL